MPIFAGTAHLLLGFFSLLSTRSLLAGDTPSLDWPISCQVNTTCFIQNYVDLDPGPHVKDFACSEATYDGHKGTDIRLLSVQEVGKSFPVLAAAAGTVKAVRDSIPDALLRERNPNAVATKECGNGVVLEHGNGWETQYCHLRAGSVRVRIGDILERGHALGLVGYSGMADFAHLHFEVRHDGKVVDPFINEEQTNTCLEKYDLSKGLWRAYEEKWALSQRGQILETEFSGNIPDLSRIEYGDALTPPTVQSPQLLFISRMINVRKGDILHIELSGPGNFNGVTEEKPLDKNKATYVVYSGRKLKEDEWPSGIYKAISKILRNSLVIDEQTSEIHLH